MILSKIENTFYNILGCKKNSYETEDVFLRKKIFSAWNFILVTFFVFIFVSSSMNHIKSFSIQKAYLCLSILFFTVIFIRHKSKCFNNTSFSFSKLMERVIINPMGFSSEGEEMFFTSKRSLYPFKLNKKVRINNMIFYEYIIKIINFHTLMIIILIPVLFFIKFIKLNYNSYNITFFFILIFILLANNFFYFFKIYKPLKEGAFYDK